jgi:prolipoprotein diacylglyceryltransferase
MKSEFVKMGIIAGFLGSLCCTVPILIVALGLGSIGFALGFARYRPFFIILGIVFLTYSLYGYIKSKEGVCNKDTLKKNLLTIVIAVIVAAIIWYLLIYVISPMLGGFVYG